MTQTVPDEMVVLSLESDVFVLIGDPNEVGLKWTETLQKAGLQYYIKISVQLIMTSLYVIIFSVFCTVKIKQYI